MLNVLMPDGSVVSVRVVRRRQRRVILHADPADGSFWISAPQQAPEAALLEFMRDQGIAWIMQQRAAYRSRAVRTTIRCRGRDCPLIYRRGPRRFEFTGGVFQITAPTYAAAGQMFARWWDDKALGCFMRHVDAWMPLFRLEHVEQPLVRVRPLKSAWGICYHNPPRVHLADRLFGTPDGLVDYVVMHELTHLIYPDHGPGFRAFLSKWMPDWLDRRRALKAELPLVTPLWPPQQA